MSQVGKLYKYYLKKSLWRSWKMWIAVALCWVWWIVLPFAVSQFSREKFKHQIERNEDYNERQREEALAFNDEVFDNEYNFKGTISKVYQGAEMSDEEAAKWWEEQAKLTDDPEKKKLYNRASLGARWTIARNKKNQEKEKITEREKEKFKRDSSNNSPFYYDLVLFSARRDSLSGMEYWQVLHNIALWNIGGFIASILLVYSLLDNLFIKTKKNGEDATVLILAPFVKRSELFISKSLAYITTLAIFTLLGFALPFGILLSVAWGVAAVPWGAFFLLLFYTTIIGSIIFFLFPASVYLFASKLGVVGSIISYFLSYFSLLWIFVNFGARMSRTSEGGGLYSVLAKAEYWYSHPLANIGLAVALGGLLLFLYYSYYQEEDLG